MFRSDTATLVRRFLHDVNGATAIEYALMAAGIGGTVAATVWSLGEGVKTNLYDKLAALF
jgi:Flp pilus assembly pilin Flp